MPPKKKAKKTQTVSLDKRTQAKMLRDKASALEAEETAEETPKKGKGGRGRPPKAQKTETAKPSRAPKSASKKTTTKNAITKDQPPLLRRSLRSRSPTPI